MPLDLAEAVLSTGTHDAPDLSAALNEAEALPDLGAGSDLGEVSDIIGPEAWQAQWGALHDMAGGLVQMRAGAPCPLGDQARSEGGLIACHAAYELIAASPARSIILGTQSGFYGQLMAVGLHGFACVQMVKAARVEGVELAARKARAEVEAKA